jgi:amidophosphoribosyltransferase
MELAARKALKEMNISDDQLDGFVDPDSEKHRMLISKIAENLGFDSLIYQRLDDLVDAIGLPREKLCTHCWDGSSYF